MTALCPSCAAGGLDPRCPDPACRAENDRADAALDRRIASTED